MADEKVFTASNLDDKILTLRKKPVKFGEVRDKEGPDSKVVEPAEDLTIRFATLLALETTSDKSTPFMKRYRRANIAKKIERVEGNESITLTKGEVKEIKECSAMHWYDRIMFAIWDRFDPDGFIELDEDMCIEKKAKDKKE